MNEGWVKAENKATDELVGKSVTLVVVDEWQYVQNEIYEEDFPNPEEEIK